MLAEQAVERLPNLFTPAEFHLIVGLLEVGADMDLSLLRRSEFGRRTTRRQHCDEVQILRWRDEGRAVKPQTSSPPDF